MDDLRGPNVQIVLHVKEGLGFGFLRSPFLVSGSLNGYLLETDPAVPSHAPVFDAELVWETDKRRFRNLRVQNVPVKVDVHTTCTQGRRNKVGYLLLSLLGAQPCPSNKLPNIKHTWHKLLGVRTEGKCCHPQLLLGLTIEDRANTITPRNELTMFHSNEVASYLPTAGNETIRPQSFTLEDYLVESRRTVSSSDMAPRLLADEGLIQVGAAGEHLFVLSFVLVLRSQLPSEDYLVESRRTVSSSDLAPRLLVDEGLIQVGAAGEHLFVLSFVHVLRSQLPSEDYLVESRRTVSSSDLAPRLLVDEGLIQVGAAGEHLFVLSFVLILRSQLPSEDYLVESRRTVSSSDLAPRLLVDEGLIQVGAAGEHLFVLSFVLVLRSQLPSEDYLVESRRTVSSSDLAPRLLVDEGLIQVGAAGEHLFVLSFVLGAAENVDTLFTGAESEMANCLVTYSVFTHTIQTDRVTTMAGGVRKSTIQFNQRTSLRLCTDLPSLSRYFTECPHVVTRLCSEDKDIGICSTDLRKLVPTEDVTAFLETFCNTDKAITIGERCFIMACPEGAARDPGRRPYIDIEISLKYVGRRSGNTVQRPVPLTARSASHLGCQTNLEDIQTEKELEIHKSRSCTEVDRDVAGVTYTNITARNTSRYKNANGEAAIESQNEVANMIRKMYETFTTSQEKLLTSMVRPTTSDSEVQCCDSPKEDSQPQVKENEEVRDVSPRLEVPTEDKQPRDKDRLNAMLSAEDRESLMKKCVEELEDWKEQQQELFKAQLQQKEEYHLEMLSAEWSKRRCELEGKLSRGIEQCRNLAADLSRATDDFRLRGYRNTHREQKLAQAKQSLEQHYTGKLQELREASQKLEDDMRHQAKLKDMATEELETRLELVLKENETFKNTILNIEKDAQQKMSGLTKDQTASLIQELRALEVKLEEALQSKAFFKEQWGRAVRELHATRLQDRRRMLAQLQRRRRRLGGAGLENVTEYEDESIGADKDLQRLKDDFYVNLLADTPINAETSITGSVPYGDGFESTSEGIMPKNVTNEKLNNLIEQRDRLIQKENPDEDRLLQLNHEIRTILLSCGT